MLPEKAVELKKHGTIVTIDEASQNIEFYE
jgi:hypothetical protein